MARTKPAVFHFKQFSVAHDNCAMKIGTDGVLLGAWASVEKSKTILDVGTGSGVIALMLAQRSSPQTKIHGIEINAPDAEQAQENVLQSPWLDKVSIFHTSFQNYSAETSYDLIISNPPFFDDSLPPINHRATARHTQSLSFSAFLDKAVQLLSPVGSLAVILPYQEGLEFMALADQQYDLHTSRKVAIYSKPGKKQERWLLEFQWQKISVQQDELYIHTASGEWSQAYQILTGAFYLKF